MPQWLEQACVFFVSLSDLNPVYKCNGFSHECWFINTVFIVVYTLLVYVLWLWSSSTWQNVIKLHIDIAYQRTVATIEHVMYSISLKKHAWCNDNTHYVIQALFVSILNMHTVGQICNLRVSLFVLLYFSSFSITTYFVSLALIFWKGSLYCHQCYQSWYLM